MIDKRRPINNKVERRYIFFLNVTEINFEPEIIFRNRRVSLRFPIFIAAGIKIREKDNTGDFTRIIRRDREALFSRDIPDARSKTI